MTHNVFYVLNLPFKLLLKGTVYDDMLKGCSKPNQFSKKTVNWSNQNRNRKKPHLVWMYSDHFFYSTTWFGSIYSFYFTNRNQIMRFLFYAHSWFGKLKQFCVFVDIWRFSLFVSWYFIFIPRCDLKIFRGLTWHCTSLVQFDANMNVFNFPHRNADKK